MIHISKSGKNIRSFELATGSASSESVYGFHRIFGFCSLQSASQRERKWNRSGLKTVDRSEWLCQFKRSGQAWTGIQDCSVTAINQGYSLSTALGNFFITEESDLLTPVSSASQASVSHKSRNTLLIALLLFFLLGLFLTLRFGLKTEEVAQVPVLQPVLVKIVQPINAVKVPEMIKALEPISKNLKKEQQVKIAVKQNLGFLGFIGRKNLTKALGGAPSQLQDASPGAGLGGKEGSGGEYLMGLGKGLRQATVGNTGVRGLGGVGTKGAGGGQGGYGNARLASGDGSRISAIPVSEDIVLEGGLSQAVIQATIAKHISQIRACYEEGLRTEPGIQGLVTTYFEVGGAGNIIRAETQKSTLGNKGVEACMISKMKTWNFPKPLGGVNVKVTYPFLLKPAR